MISADEMAVHLSFFVPPGYALMAQPEVDRIHNESEALRIERDAARAEAERLEETIESHAAQCDAGESVRAAAMAVVMNWDLGSSQHGTMPALREALGLPRERPTREEALERFHAGGYR